MCTNMVKEIVGILPMQADLLHPGHLAAIEEAKQYCDKLIIALNYSDNKTKQIETCLEKYLRLRAVKSVNEIIPYTGEEQLLSLLQLVPHQVRFIGEDYKDKNFTGKQYEQELNIQLIYLHRRHSYSSTEYRNRLKNP